MDLLKAITQSILAQKQHPGPFLETREQELSFGTKINGIFCFIVGDISFLSFDRGYIFPTVAAKGAAQQATICGGGVHTQVEIHLSPFKC